MGGGGSWGELVTRFFDGGTWNRVKVGEKGSWECGEAGEGSGKKRRRGRGSGGGPGGLGLHIWGTGREKGLTSACTAAVGVCPHVFAHLGPQGFSHLEDTWGTVGEGRGFSTHIWDTKDLQDIHVWEGWVVWGMQLPSDQQLERSLMSQLGTQLKAQACSSTSGEPGGFHLCTSGGTR